MSFKKLSYFPLWLLSTVICANFVFAEQSAYTIFNEGTDTRWLLDGRLKDESFFGKNISLLNDCNDWDRIIYSRHTLDLGIDVAYGLNTYGHTAAEFKCTSRSKAIWGDTGSIARTNNAELKIVDSVGQEHSHSIPRLFFWMRECWLELSLGDMLDIPALENHTFTLGAFPFMLGRGIALGDAYAVGPELLGFYSDSAIDQFAFGAKFAGSVIEDVLFYELYAAILDNKSSSLSHTGAHIRNQEIGHIQCPERGFGRINVVYAGHLLWHACNSDRLGHLVIEPYWMVNKDPEQTIEFKADTSSTLATFGCAVEFEHDRFEFGFDTAVNVGHQAVRGWDRNTVTQASQLVIENNLPNRSVLVFQNSHVVDADDNKIPHNQSSAWGKAIQKAIDVDAIENQNQNGKKIATVVNPDNNIQSVELFNAEDRFRNPYNNRYRGWMFVADAAVNFCNKDLQWAVTSGIASGDRNPNEDVIDQDFKGFIGLQELYSGKRVRSAFFFGGAGRLQRPLAIPSEDSILGEFASTVSGFTDIRFVGTGLKWEPQDRARKYMIHPNIISYWKDASVPKFDVASGKDIPGTCARNYLGTEVALFSHVYLLENLSLFSVASVFIPGGHYTDIKGKPLNKNQQKALDRADRTGFEEGRIPNIGDNIAFTINIGLEFRF